MAFVEHVCLDVRHALRRLDRERSFAFAGILTIGLAVGLNTAIFSVTNAVLLRPLPYAAPGRLVIVGKGYPGYPRPVGLDEGEYRDWLESQQVFSGMGTETSWSCDLIVSGVARRMEAVKVSASLLPLLGVKPILGRGFVPDEEQAGRDKVVILGEAIWRELFAADPHIIGKHVRLSEVGSADLFEVVGVAPRSFRLHYATAAGAFRSAPASAVEVIRPTVPLGTVYARLKPGVTPEQARAATYQVYERLKRAQPKRERTPSTGQLMPLHEAIFGSTRPAILMLTAAVALVLLMGCTNVAALLLSRGAARQQEMSIRSALGGTRARLFQQLVTENLVTAVLGGGVGLLLAFWATSLLGGFIPAELVAGREVGIDWTVLAFTAVMSLATGLLLGVVPARQAATAEVMAVLRGNAGASGHRPGQLRRLLVGGQVAIVVVLLAVAGLMLNSAWRMARTDLGFDTSRVAAALIRLNNQSCTPGKREAFRADLLSRVRALPGVVEAATTSDLPFSTGGVIGFQLPGRVRSGGNRAELYVVDDQYLTLMRYPLKGGRLLAQADREGGSVAVVNEAFANEYFRGDNPLGQTIVVKDAYEVVGVVGNHRELLSRSSFAALVSVRNMSNEATTGPLLKAMAPPAIYIPSAQANFGWCAMFVLARTSPDPRGLFSAIRAQVAAVDPNQAVSELATLGEWAASPAIATRFYAVALGVFSAVATVLAAVGIYGVLAQAVARRVREIGIRIALGATRSQVARLVTSQVLGPVVLGIAAGLAGALAATRMLSSFLFDLTPADPLTYGVVVLILLLVAASAAYLPVRRAASVEPMTALRWE